MSKRLKDIKEIKIERPPRAKLSAEESLKRTQEFDKRKERFIASIRKQGLRFTYPTFLSQLTRICLPLSVENSLMPLAVALSYADWMGAISLRRARCCKTELR